MADARRNLKVLKHVRDINNFIRKKVLEGVDLTSEQDRAGVIQSFLDTFTVGKPGAVQLMTPETFAFFLQKLNAHGLFESMDNKNYSIVFPNYVPFDVEAEAAKYGYTDIYSKIENNLRRRASGVGEVKTASAFYRSDSDSELFDKVASAAQDREEVESSDVGRDYKQSRSLHLGMLKDKAASMYWKFSNIEDFVKTSVFKSDPARNRVYEDLKKTSVRGGRDKKASLSDFNVFLELVDEIASLKDS